MSCKQNLDQRLVRKTCWNSVSTSHSANIRARRTKTSWDYRFSNLYQDAPKGAKFPKLSGLPGSTVQSLLESRIAYLPVQRVRSQN